MAGLPYGLQAMLKEGHKHFSGLEEAVMKNIDACKSLSQIVRTSLGPNGMNKMVVNHLEKLFVTSDASTIVSELEVQHPAAKLLVMAARAQEQEIGDGTNLALEVLDSLIVQGSENLDVRDKAEVAKRIKGSISSKINGYEDFLSNIVADACISVCPKNPVNFNVDNVRVVKIQGGSLLDSQVVQGMVFRRDTEGTLKHVENGKVAVYSQGVDTSSTETKGTVLIKNAQELENYAKSEENKLEEYIQGIADAGVKVLASGGAIGEMAMHFIEKHNMMAIRIPSKFDLSRLCKATGATARATMGVPQPDELGFAKLMTVQEIGGSNCVVLRQDSSQGQVSTIVLRGSTEGFLDDVERALNDAINSYKALTKEARVVPAGGATEIELARKVAEFGSKQTGLEQYAIVKYAEAFEVVPRTLAENSGLNASNVLSGLYAAHTNGQVTAGVDTESGAPTNLSDAGIVDLYSTKWWAIKLATEAVVTVLKVDQIIMSKQAGGPKRPPGGGDDE